MDAPPLVRPPSATAPEVPIAPSPSDLLALAAVRRRAGAPGGGGGGAIPGRAGGGRAAREGGGGGAAAVDVAGERLTLHPERAVHWPARRTLLVADLHLGKEHAFGRRGIAIPAGPSEAGLARLARLIAATGVERLAVLGDLMHDAPDGPESWLGALSGVLDTHRSLAVEVCAGNHDRPEAHAALDARLTWLAEPVVDGPFVLRHHPRDDPRGHVLAGHLHPVHRVGRARGAGLRLPAFWLRPGHAVLPAFGEFTGGLAVRPERGDRLWVAGPERVVRVTLRRG